MEKVISEKQKKQQGETLLVSIEGGSSEILQDNIAKSLSGGRASCPGPGLETLRKDTHLPAVTDSNIKSPSGDVGFTQRRLCLRRPLGNVPLPLSQW